MGQLSHYFYELIHQNRLVHGYVFTGDDYESKEHVSTELIKALGCLNKDEVGQPCGVCEHCQKAQNHQLADVVSIQPDGQSIRVNQIRELKEWLSTSPIESNFKLAIIESAETMNPSSANALLTFLEEPVEGVYLVLYTQDKSNLLPTIQSRVQSVHFPRANVSDRVAYYIETGVSEAHARIFAKMSSETAQRLVSDYEEADVTNWFKSLNYFYSTLAHGNLHAVILVQTQLKNSLSVQQALDGMDYLLILNHSMLRILSNTEVENLTQAYFINEVIKTKQPSLAHILELNDLILETKQRLQANVAPQLATERLAILASQ